MQPISLAADCLCMYIHIHILSIPIYLSRVKVGSSKHVLEVDVSVWLFLLKLEHGISLTKERAGSPQLTKFYQLQNYLQKTKKKRIQWFVQQLS